MSDRLVRQHAAAVLQHWTDRHAQLEAIYAGLEAQGKRIVDSRDNVDGWQGTDHRTGEVIASGTGGGDELTALLDSSPAADWEWANDHLDDVYNSGDRIITEGLPESLCAAIAEWVDQPNVSHEELAEFVGWPVERVKAARADL